MTSVAWIVVLLSSPQEPPKVTYEDSGDFRLLALDLDRRFKGRIRFAKGIPSKDVSISVRDAGYFEALDALCRAHQGVTYLPMENDKRAPLLLTLAPQSWVEFPASYSGHFKVALASLMRTAGAGSWAEATLVLFAPPWIEPKRGIGTRTQWILTQARDAADRNLLDAGPEGDERIRIHPEEPDGGGVVAAHSIRLKDFDTARGLKALAGRIDFTACEVRVVRLSAEEGATVEVPGGKLTVASVEKRGEGSAWRIGVTYASDSKKSLRSGDILAFQARHDGGTGEWEDLLLEDRSFELETGHVREAPRWIELKSIQSTRDITVPFTFTDAVFRKD